MYDKILDNFLHKNIVVIGDLILDKYIYGNVERISPEAPIPVVDIQKEKYVLGGAANVAANVMALKGKVSIMGVLGNDQDRTLFLKKAKQMNIDISGITIDKTRRTTKKVRVIGKHQQLLRIDFEHRDYINKFYEENIINRIKKRNNIDVIIISDYAKGVITKNLMTDIKQIARDNQILVLVDPKPKHKEFYKNVDIITPNKIEAEAMSNRKISNKQTLEEVGNYLAEDNNADFIITTGEKGMSVFSANHEVHHIPTRAKDVYDVSGAGDTVVATLALSLSSGANLPEAANIANFAAGIEVSKMGTAPVYIDELRKKLSKENISN